MRALPLPTLLLLGCCLDAASLGAPCSRDADCADDLRCAVADDVGVCAPRGLDGREGEGEGEGEACVLRDVLLTSETIGQARVATNGAVVAAAFSATTIAPTRGGSVSFRIEGIGDGAIVDADTITSSTDAVMVVDGLAWSEALQRFGLLFHEETSAEQYRGPRLATFDAEGNVSGVEQVTSASASSGTIAAHLLPSPTGFVIVTAPRPGTDIDIVGVIAFDGSGPTTLDEISGSGVLLGSPVAADDGIFVAWQAGADPANFVRVARIAGGVVTASALTFTADANFVAAQVLPDGASVRLLFRTAGQTSSVMCVLPGCAAPVTVALQPDTSWRPSVAVGRRGVTLAVTEVLGDSTKPASVVTLDLDDGTIVQRKRWSDDHGQFSGSVAVLDGVGLMAGSTDDAQFSRELRLVIACDAEAW